MSSMSNYSIYSSTNYFKQIPIAIKSFQPVLLDFVNFIDPSFIKFYCGQNCQNPESIQSALELAKRVYEVPLRQLRDNLGYSFPINSEILGYAMKLAKNEIVVELGGARGENSMLLAFSDAQEVYYNEIIPDEIQAFETQKKGLPEKVRSKLKTVSGSCFNILEKCPELQSKVGLVFCRNLLHFFNDREQIEFFNMVKKIIKPGGRGIFTVNSSFNYPKALYEQEPRSTSFTITQCTYEDFNVVSRSQNFLYQDFSHCDPSLIPISKYSLAFNLFERKIGESWKKNEKNFQQLPKDIKETIQKVTIHKNPVFEDIKEGCVKIIRSHIRSYRYNQLCDLFSKNGFEAINQFAVSLDGHLVLDSNLSQITQIGVIVRYNPS